MNCIIIEDEPLAQNILKKYISNHPELCLCETFATPLKAIDYLREHTIDLIFLDINMPQWSGLDFYASLDNAPLVIFTTAYHEFAVKGFELNATDYLMKPFSPERFSQAVEKARIQFNTRKQESYVLVKSDRKEYRVTCSSIYFVEALSDYIRLHTSNGILTCKKTLKAFKEDLPKESFIQVHKSFIINKKHIHSLTSSEVICHQEKIPIGRVYKTQLKEVFSINQNNN